MSIKRAYLVKLIKESLKFARITILVGPRQVGKTTLARDLFKNHKKENIHFFDLEDPTDFDLLDNAKLTLEPLEGLILIDEVQRKPELFKYLRVKADQMKKSSKIILLGSSSRDLIEQASETLAGRVNYIEVPGFSIAETSDVETLFYRGTFPLSFLAKTNETSYQWRRIYTQSYVERDLKLLGIDLPPQSLRRMLEMLVGYHGQIFNASEIGKSLGFSHTTARKYLDILISTFLIRELKPWSESILQRQVKQPKIYFRDVGLVHYFMGLKSKNEVIRNPKLGHLWEGFALEETIKLIHAENEDLYFWALHQNGELDLLWKTVDKKIGFEFKYADSPKVTSSMEKALDLLKLDHLYVVYPGHKKAKLHEKITLIPLGKPIDDS
jgi:predicted AAA+ superfamily ATPase